MFSGNYSAQSGGLPKVLIMYADYFLEFVAIIIFLFLYVHVDPFFDVVRSRGELHRLVRTQSASHVTVYEGPTRSTMDHFTLTNGSQIVSSDVITSKNSNLCEVCRQHCASRQKDLKHRDYTITNVGRRGEERRLFRELQRASLFC